MINTALEPTFPEVSARNWAIIDGKTGRLMHGYNETESRQVASLTKIMTAYCVLNLLES
jgi:serine-type D-Ala-D-Ala carboxypeptidase (penicillin-binding protein 5/6)